MIVEQLFAVQIIPIHHTVLELCMLGKKKERKKKAEEEEKEEEQEQEQEE